MWVSRFSFSSMTTHNYLYDLQFSNKISFILMQNSGIFSWLGTIINLDFLGFRVGLLNQSQIKTFSNATLTSFCKEEKSLSWVQRKVSSAKSLTYKFVAQGKSLINNKNKSGPKIDPWGTPNSTLVNEDLIPFGNLTNWDLELKYDLNKSRALEYHSNAFCAVKFGDSQSQRLLPNLKILHMKRDFHLNF